MSQVSKNELKYQNSVSFPNNNSGEISPADLRNFNVELIDSTVNQTLYTEDSSSFNGRIDSNTTQINNINAFTASIVQEITSLEAFTSSQQTINNAQQVTNNQLLFASTSFENQIDVISAQTSSYLTTSGSNNFVGNQTISGSLNVSGSLTASIQEGYALVGGAGGISTLIPTSSFGAGTLPSGVVSGSQQITDLGFVSSSITGSSLVTASLSGNTITFTKGDSSTFGFTIPDVSGSDISALNQFTASQLDINSGYNTFTQSADSRLDNIELETSSLQNQIDGLSNVTSSYISTSSFNSFTESVDGRLDNIELTTASLQSEVDNLQSVTGSYATTGSNTFTGDQTFVDGAGNTITLSDASGSLMLVAKTFTSASAHLTASAGNQVNLIFKNNDNTADTIISGSNNLFVNPTAPTAGYKRYVGGSGNIMLSATAIPQITGSIGYSPTMTNNYIVGPVSIKTPFSASAFTINNNSIIGQVQIGNVNPPPNGQLAKLTSGLTMNTNNIYANLNINAFGAGTELTGSTPGLTNNIINGFTFLNFNNSAASLSTNIFNDGQFTLTHNSFSSSAGLGTAFLTGNIITGASNTIVTAGSYPAGTTNAPNINANLVVGGSNTLFTDLSTARVSGVNAYHNILRTAVLGNSLIVSGSSLTTDLATIGSAFVGRFNAQDGSKSKTAETIFAVGTGTATGTRKTGFLIDSGSNTFVEGSLNVSGSSSFTGSLVLSSSAAVELQVIGGTEITGSFGVLGSTFVSGSVRGNVAIPSISSNTASLDFGSANFFEVTLVSSADTHIVPQNVRSGQTINLKVSQPGVGTGTISFPSTFKFPEVAPYTASLLSNSVDVVTFITFEDTGSIYSVAVKRLV